MRTMVLAVAAAGALAAAALPRSPAAVRDTALEPLTPLAGRDREAPDQPGERRGDRVPGRDRVG